MANHFRLAKRLGCAVLASTCVYAATSNNNDMTYLKSFVPLASTIKPLSPQQNPESACTVDGREIEHTPGASKFKLQDSIEKARELCERARVKHGLPGLTIAVTVNGKLVYDEGFGYADVENNVKMNSDVIMRIASISKSMTMAMMAKLIEEGKVNIDLPVQTYLPTFPEKQVDGLPVVITTRHLLSHLSGIRHYTKKGAKKKKNDESDSENQEFYLKDKFDSIEKAMQLFIHDELHHPPGTKYLYSSHAWTVVAGIIEKLVDTPFPKHAKSMFTFWGLKNTHLDEHEPLIYNRARYYTRNKHGKLINSPYVDNSYKWSGGGFLSNVHDLTQFANMLLFCHQQADNFKPSTCEMGLPKKPYLKYSTTRQMWTGNPKTATPDSDFLYGLGFAVCQPLRNCMFCKERDMVTVQHSGGAIGASSILMLTFPQNYEAGHDTVDNNRLDNQNVSTEEDKQICGIRAANDVKGISVAMITNLTDVGLSSTAQEIANLFKWLI